MAFPTNSIYFSFGGYLVTTSEEWQTGIHFSNPVDPGSAVVVEGFNQISITDCYNAVAALIGSQPATGLAYQTATTLEWAKLAAIGRDGLYLTDAKLHEQKTPGATGGAGAISPPQLAIVVSLWSGSRFGRANRGRCYMPVPSGWTGMDVNTGMMTQTNVDLMRDKFKTMLAAVAGEVETVIYPNDPVILSSIGAGAINRIEQIGVGRIMDTMQSRRKSLDDSINNWTPV